MEAIVNLFSHDQSDVPNAKGMVTGIETGINTGTNKGMDLRDRQIDQIYHSEKRYGLTGLACEFIHSDQNVESFLESKKRNSICSRNDISHMSYAQLLYYLRNGDRQLL